MHQGLTALHTGAVPHLRDFHTGEQWELFCVDGLVFIADTLDGWKDGMESKGLYISTWNIKFLVADEGLYRSSTPVLSAAEIDNNSIDSSRCKLPIHKKCRSITGRLIDDPNYVCPWVAADDGTMLDVEATFCYLGSKLCANGGCGIDIAARCCVAWGKFRKHLSAYAPR